MLDDGTRLTQIRDHYGWLSGLYLALWGERLHHGYFEGEESPAAAQVRLVEHVAERAAIERQVCELKLSGKP
jgi:hypothetical protein